MALKSKFHYTHRIFMINVALGIIISYGSLDMYKTTKSEVTTIVTLFKMCTVRIPALVLIIRIGLYRSFPQSLQGIARNFTLEMGYNNSLTHPFAVHC